MRRKIKMRKTLYILTALVMVTSMLLAACGPTATVAPTTEPVEPVATEVPAVVETETPAGDAATATPEAPTVTPTPTAYPTAAVKDGFTQVRWFIGLGTGTNPDQLLAEQSVVDDFNAMPERATDKIQLQMEVVPFASAKDTILTEIASGNGPDVIGPVGWSGSAALYGQWADLATEIKSIPDITKDFDPALLKSYESSEGQIGLPFAVYPSAFFFNTALFDEAGLAYPPSKYGDKYMLDGKEVVWDWETTVKTVAQKLTVDANGKNATEDGFDSTKIVQYGFSWNFEGQPSYVGSFWESGSFTDASGTKAQIPASWRAAWAWTYDGVWGKQPFIINGQAAGSPDFGNGNVFSSGKVAMIDQPAWYTCCTGADLKTWDLGAMPSYKGKVAGRIDADTFRIWKGTKVKAEAFKVLTYLVTTGVQKLIIGSKEMPAAYGALPARAADQAPWLAAKKETFPWVKNWDLFPAGLSYPDSPSAEAYMPNYNEAWTATGAAYSKWLNTSGLDINAEADALLKDLQAIFDKK
jgi:multiple sugar transport system substrate-binding protein